MFLRSAAACAALLLCASGDLAQDITLTSDNGNLRIEGRFLGFDGDYIRVDTEHGQLTVDYHSVTCAGVACPDPETFVELIRFAGTGRIGDLILPALVEGYARENALSVDRREIVPGHVRYELSRPGAPSRIRLEFRISSTEEGFEAMSAGEADIAMAARPIPAEDLGPDLWPSADGLAATRQIRLLAYDAVVPVVSAASPTGSITLTQLAEVFAGEVGNWAEIGGPDEPIALHIGNPETGLGAFFVGQVLAQAGLGLSPDARIHRTDREVVDAVMVDPAAIGLVSFERVGNAIPLPLTGLCGLSDVATLNTVKTGDFPLTVPLYLYLPAYRLGPFGRDFIDWISGAEAQRILRRIGVPGEIAAPIPLSEQGDRIVGAIQRAGDELGLGPLLSLADTIENRERLSPTFRFEPGSSTLDPLSLARVRALARAIAEGRYAGRDLVLIGFSDSAGPPVTNLTLSEARATATLDAIQEALGGRLPAGQSLEVVALGEVMPVTCDETIWGQRVNRRVELWATRDP